MAGVLKRLLLLAAAGAVLGGIWFWWACGSAVGDRPALVEVPLGASRMRIATLLRNGGAIRSRPAFLLASRLGRGPLRAGEYEFAAGETLFGVVAKLRAGKVKLHAIVVPPGFDADQIAQAVAGRGLVTAASFLEAIADPALLSAHHLPTRTAEGYLFPDTYLVPRAITARQLVAMMLDQFERKVGPQLRSKAADGGYSVQAMMTLASLIERETAKADERPVVSAVFRNRQKQKIRLESCATVYYALKQAGRTPAGAEGQVLSGAGIPKGATRLTLADLDVDSPYNTYRHRGLPPGPICSPGLPAIEAAVSPANVPYLFFVSRGDGGHDFAVSYEEFLKDKRQNRRRPKADKNA